MFDDDFQEDEGMENVSKYEELRKSKSPIFFDVDEFGSIIDFYLRNNQFNSADEVTSLAAHLHPDSIEIQIKRTQVLISKGNSGEAFGLLDELKKKDPGNFEIYLTQGVACLNSNEPFKARECLKQAISHAKTADDRIDIYVSFAQEYVMNSYPDEALGCFGKAAALTESTDIYYDFAEFCLENEKYDEAIEVLEQMLEKEPFHINGWLNLAGAYIYTRRDRDAKKALDYAIAIKPDDSFAHYLVGLSYFNRDEFVKAISSLKKSLEFDSDSIQALKLMIDIIWQTGDPADSKEYLDRYINLLPDDAEAYFMYSGLFTDDPVKRKEYIRIAAEKDTGNVIYTTAYASECAMSGEYAVARRYADIALAFDESYDKAWVVLSVCEHYTSGPKDAWKIIIKGLKKAKGMSSSLCMMLSYYNFSMNRLKAGWRYYFRAVSFTGAYTELPFVLTDYFETGAFRQFIQNKKNR